jgi:hypothetical protein
VRHLVLLFAPPRAGKFRYHPDGTLSCSPSICSKRLDLRCGDDGQIVAIMVGESKFTLKSSRAPGGPFMQNGEWDLTMVTIVWESITGESFGVCRRFRMFVVVILNSASSTLRAGFC